MQEEQKTKTLGDYGHIECEPDCRVENGIIYDINR